MGAPGVVEMVLIGLLAVMVLGVPTVAVIVAVIFMNRHGDETQALPPPPASSTCPKCLEPIQPTDQFCANCGAGLQDAGSHPGSNGKDA